MIYDPAKDELFIAERGKGAYLNNRRIRVAARRDLADALIDLRPAASRTRQPSAFLSEARP